jgi:hypothetical protein
LEMMYGNIIVSEVDSVTYVVLSKAEKHVDSELLLLPIPSNQI